METIQVKFKNLPVQYYFLYKTKLYQKINDYTGAQLFSKLDLPQFSNVSSHYKSVDENLNYTRPASVMVQFEAEELVEFVKFIDIRKILSDKFYESRSGKKFIDLPVGQYFLNKNDNTYYKKISFYKAFPVYNSRIGLTDIQSVDITSVSSSNIDNENVNCMYYNGELLFNYGKSPWNIVWFNPSVTSYHYQSFETMNDWSAESNRMLLFISNIPDGSIVFIVTSNNPSYCTDSHKVSSNKNFSRILTENPQAEGLLYSVGLDRIIIESLGHLDSLALIVEKNKRKLFYKKISASNRPGKYPILPEKEIIECSYQLTTKSKTYEIGLDRNIELDLEVTPVTQKEVNTQIMYNLSKNDSRTLSEEEIFDLT